MIPLSPRTQVIFEFLSRAATAGDPTPTNAQIRAAMEESGHHLHSREGDDSRSDIIGYELSRLYRAGLMAVIGVQRYRIFEVVSTGARTKRREHFNSEAAREASCEQKRLAHAVAAGWPKVTEESAAPYDRAVAERLFARHELRPPAKEAPRVHGAMRAGVERHSFVGCSAAMAVA